jgi:hypothetical protein
MAAKEEARKNHDELFPGHVSTLQVTDSTGASYCPVFDCCSGSGGSGYHAFLRGRRRLGGYCLGPVPSPSGAGTGGGSLR